MSSNFSTDAELEALVSANVRPDGEEFRPVVYQNVEGDSIEFILSEEDYYSERLDGFVTVLVGQETGQVVGSVIKGVSTRIQQMMEQRSRGVNVEIHNGERIALEYFFEPEECPVDQPAKRIIYKRLQKAARQANAMVELCST